MSVRIWRALIWAAVAGWAGVIFAFSATPGSRLPGGNAVLAHFTEYAVLGALAFMALRLDLPTRTAGFSATIGASLYAITDEVHQAFVPLRTPDPLDWAVDTVGAVAGVLLLVVAVRVLTRSRS